jgi:uncharacterized PurR-regulated membrane protein YhhQ (DUF165 family)
VSKSLLGAVRVVLFHKILYSALIPIADYYKEAPSHSLMPTPSTRFKYLDALTTAFVVILLVSNLIAQKICMIGPLPVSGAIILFPITYIFGDVFTEVYGFAASRRAIWFGFFGTALLYAMGAIIIALPAAPDWKNQQAFATVFGFIPRILAASLIAFWAGEFANSYTIVGQAVDTVLVITLTFAGTVGVRTLLKIIVTGYLLKVAYETIATPITYLVINFLKRAEHSDPFDRHESFNPFSLKQSDTPLA